MAGTNRNRPTLYREFPQQSLFTVILGPLYVLVSCEPVRVGQSVAWVTLEKACLYTFFDHASSVDCSFKVPMDS